MQRVRIGLTGLALVFLLVLIGAVIRSASTDEGVSVNLADPSTAPSAAANGQEPTEPLAQLGVAPGSAESDNKAGTKSGAGKK